MTQRASRLFATEHRCAGCRVQPDSRTVRDGVDVLRLSGASPSQWERFLEGRADAETPLFDRWSRVRALGVSPLGVRELPIVSQSVLSERKDCHGELLHASSPVLTSAASVMSERHYTLLLCDPAGLVLARWGGGEFEPIAQATRLIEGADWSEPARGTNAIGTGLAERRAVAVEGCAHYARDNHALACYASPLHGPDGRLVGLVDATSFSEAASPFVSVAMAGIARSIEDRLATLAWERAGVGSVAAVLERLREPAVIIDERGRAHFTNREARAELFGGERPRLVRGPDGAWVAPGRASTWRTRVEPVGPGMSVVYFEPPRAPQLTATTTSAFDVLLGHDPTLLEAKQKAARFARTPLPVLLLAETGTGKELLARALHDASPRHEGPFVAVNCGALSSQLLETELFGYGSGAFTGARAGGQPGKLEIAHGGTLFLDEVAEMPPSLQAMLLRVLEDGTLYRVGEPQPRQVDLRLVCATCRDLEAMVRAGTFRSDLYFRIRGATLSLPPLAQRTDVLALAEALLLRLAREQGRSAPQLSTEVRQWLRDHDWPGNVRELKSTLAHAVALADDEVRLEHLPRSLSRIDLRPRPVSVAEPTREAPSSSGHMSAQPPPPAPSPVPREGTALAVAPSDAVDLSREDAERRALVAAITRADGNLTVAAKYLGVARSTLYRMMDRHRLAR
jgi:transcriptional regulator of acetoin/glycerol metabolism